MFLRQTGKTTGKKGCVCFFSSQLAIGALPHGGEDGTGRALASGGACTYWGERCRPPALAAGMGARRVQTLLMLGSDGPAEGGGVFLKKKSLLKSFTVTACWGNSAALPKNGWPCRDTAASTAGGASPAHPGGHMALWRRGANKALCSGSKKKSFLYTFGGDVSF